MRRDRPSAGVTDVEASNSHLNDINLIARPEITNGLRASIHGGSVTRGQMQYSSLACGIPRSSRLQEPQGFVDLGGLSVERSPDKP